MTIKTFEQWLQQDPNQTDKISLQLLIAQAKTGNQQAKAELDDSFATELSFGTAGLRAKLGVGPNRMNSAVVIKTSAGLSAFLKQASPNPSLIVGYDARHGSKQFALDTVAVATAAGINCFIFSHPIPTPVLAFALKKLNLDAAVMITASHNPAQDNGYKLYLGGKVVSDSGQGAQIINPYEQLIVNCIKSSPNANQIALAKDGWQVLDHSIVEQYLDRLQQLFPYQKRNLTIVYTPMHGVGGDITLSALKAAGFDDIHLVKSQFSPNPDFPTVAFPNPEEAGCLDLAIQLANKVKADLIIAQDPDADRCAIAIPNSQIDNGWQQLSGDEVGAILGDFFAQRYTANSSATVANSIVSSRLLEKIAQYYNISYQTSLTGFKYLARIKNLVYAYEESIGYCIDPVSIKDKDGISTALLLAHLAQQQKTQQASLFDILKRLAKTFGLFKTKSFSIRVTELNQIKQLMQQLRQQGLTSLAKLPISQSIDLLTAKSNLPPTNALIYFTQANDRVIVRPSGTEAKLKCYIEVIIPATNDFTQASEQANIKIAQIQQELTKILSI